MSTIPGDSLKAAVANMPRSIPIDRSQQVWVFRDGGKPSTIPKTDAAPTTAATSEPAKAASAAPAQPRTDVTTYEPSVRKTTSLQTASAAAIYHLLQNM